MGSGMSKAVIGGRLEELKAELEVENNNLSKLIERSGNDLNALENATLDIAITGASGAGKSSFVNALRGIKDDEEGAAEIGITQTTMEIKGYPHPTSPKVTIWDLPGIGTPQFEAKQYLQMVNFATYDFFIIVASDRFTEHDVFLGREIHNMKKKFYYVRSKVDISIDSEKRKRNFCKEKTLEKIRKYCFDCLAEAGETHPRVFLISSIDLKDYDFPLLVDTLENDLDRMKRYVLITTVSGFSKAILKKKKAAMEALIWRVALVSSVTGAIPVPGLFFVCNVPFLEATMINFSKAFGLDKDSLHRLANQVHKPVFVLTSAIRKTRVADRIDEFFVKDLLRQHCTGEGIKMLGKMIVDFIPLLGSVFGGLNSFSCLSHMLQCFLDDAQEDAERVWATAFEI
ncbi:PREDICTED: interferon-inducible GTPase 5-like [Gekko japonicus]|uniref:Interferon-inducible GTPase 5-like n=1 Tax=Gekko japonicus TaxID=146911 RepID=A0ABM1KC00_GEKJA|nr:PREDICTED: interferon-inducible GTPase 5-like [Gekko japonicus]